MLRSQHICVTMHLHVAGDVQILSLEQILNIKHTSLVVNGPCTLLGIRHLKGHFPKHGATSAELGSDGPFQSRAKQLVLERSWGHSAIYWEALCCVGILRGKGAGSHGVLTIARCCWPRQAREAACSVPSCSSLPLPAVSDGGIEMGTALQPWVNAEEGLRAWLPAS